jgi:large subunit ribosomal protein L35
LQGGGCGESAARHFPFNIMEVEMPKLKTHRGAAKRFKVTGSGKIKRGHGYKSHLLTSKPSKRTRHLRTPALVSESDYDGIKKLLPYM